MINGSLLGTLPAAIPLLRMLTATISAYALSLTPRSESAMPFFVRTTMTPFRAPGPFTAPATVTTEAEVASGAKFEALLDAPNFAAGPLLFCESVPFASRRGAPTFGVAAVAMAAAVAVADADSGAGRGV